LEPRRGGGTPVEPAAVEDEARLGVTEEKMSMAHQCTATDEDTVTLKSLDVAALDFVPEAKPCR
jgi:hypothetical protein